jgi:hypothetical protein
MLTIAEWIIRNKHSLLFLMLIGGVLAATIATVGVLTDLGYTLKALRYCEAFDFHSLRRWLDSLPKSYVVLAVIGAFGIAALPVQF